MTDTELLQLRRTVRRDDDITDSAARLFSEIVDLAMLDDGCTASLTQLGAWVSMSERTVRRRRDELKEAGYLRVSACENRRQLVPCKTDGHECRTQVTDKTGQTSEVADNSGQNQPDKFGQHKENNNTYTREPAHARGEDTDSGEVGEMFDTLISVMREAGTLTGRKESTAQLLSEKLAGEYSPVIVKDALREDLDGSLREWSGKVFREEVLPRYVESMTDTKPESAQQHRGNGQQVHTKPDDPRTEIR